MRLALLGAVLLAVGSASTVATILAVLRGVAEKEEASLPEEAALGDEEGPTVHIPRAYGVGVGGGGGTAGKGAASAALPPTPLVVGGTDGSGTRSVAALLDQLGVPLVADNQMTLDAEGRVQGGVGWPQTVRPILRATRSADYEIPDLPPGVADVALERLGRFWTYHGRRRKRVREKVAGSDADRARAAGATYAFKAPVTMLLAPLLAEVAARAGDGGIRFLHVVRDGRDIAYSDNQSPVTKFYNLTFPDKTITSSTDADGRVRAIKLWSAWNSQLLAWGRRTLERERRRREDEEQGSASPRFDYLVLHSEDLVSPDVEVRRAAIASVARFAGARVDDGDICCLAAEETASLGSHTATAELASSVAARYGKWRGRASPETAEVLNRVGGEGLRAFGYDPHVRTKDQVHPLPDGACDTAVCGAGWDTPYRLAMGRGTKGNGANPKKLLRGPADGVRDKRRQRLRLGRRERRGVGPHGMKRSGRGWERLGERRENEPRP